MRESWPARGRPAPNRALSLLAAVALIAATLATPAVGAGVATSATGVKTGESGLPVPRFVSLKAGRVNVRAGPGEDYKIAWVFTRVGLPIEIIQEFDTWRRVRDADGSVGWIFHSLLSGKRTAVVAPWDDGTPRPLRARASPDSAITAYLEPGVLAAIERCRAGWCRLSGNGFDGWIEEEQLWGVYPDEDVD
jgi:SH3-like domain-containing protein